MAKVKTNPLLSLIKQTKLVVLLWIFFLIVVGTDMDGQEAIPSKHEYINQLIAGDDYDAARALIKLAEFPETALENCTALLEAIPKCSGEIRLSVLPIGPERFNPKWTRSEIVLVWVANSIRKAPFGENRRRAQTEVLKFCANIFKGNEKSIGPAVAYEASAACIFYGNFSNQTLIIPEEGRKEFLEVLKLAVERKSPVYEFSNNKDLNYAITIYNDSIDACMADKKEEYLGLLGVESRITPMTDWAYGTIQEKEFNQYKCMTSKEIVNIIKDNGAKIDNPHIAAYGYILCETRKKQSEVMQDIIDLSLNHGVCYLKLVAQPVFDVSCDYEKAIQDKSIDCLEAILKQSQINNGGRVGKCIYYEALCKGTAMHILGKLSDYKKRDPERKDIYQRKRIALLLANQLFESDMEDREYVVEPLGIVAACDKECAEIAFNNANRALEELRALKMDKNNEKYYDSTNDHIERAEKAIKKLSEYAKKLIDTEW